MILPTILLVRPQLVENIGAVARAMLNCEVTELRLVAPRDGWPKGQGFTPTEAEIPAMPDWIAERLTAAASGADEILKRARIFPSLAAAVADLQMVYATTARDHAMVKPWSTPRAAAAAAVEKTARAERVGFLFGPERTGLTHEDMVHAQGAIAIPANPAFSSFNLAQAVLLLCYEWHVATKPAPAERLPESPLATQAEMDGLLQRLEAALTAKGFFTTEAMRPTMARNIRHTLQRAAMTEQEVRTWHGIISALLKKDEA
jgi:tRNA/rRNA methyltransferase